nr:deoxynucleoside kinase [Anaerolineae bacterium]
MTKRFLLVAGNIGAGKTTLTGRVATRLGWDAGYETVSTNPFLADFYEDMKQWSFHLQVYFLGDRAAQHRKLADQPRSAIIDRSIYEDAHIFARALHAMDNMTDREFFAYRRVYEQVVDSLPVPDLLLYLEASVPVLLDRIQSRGREIESGISADYLSLLNTYYHEWLSGFDMCPVLTVPADNLNFVTNDGHIAIIIDRIQQKLAGKDTVVFPPELQNGE